MRARSTCVGVTSGSSIEATNRSSITLVPAEIWAPTSIDTDITMAAAGATRSWCIFIDSMTASTMPFATRSPGPTRTSSTRPWTGEVIIERSTRAPESLPARASESELASGSPITRACHGLMADGTAQWFRILNPTVDPPVDPPVDPLLGLLRAQVVPPRPAATDATMARPRPDPGAARAAFERWNRSKTKGRSSGGMPGPWSVTSINTVP